MAAAMKVKKTALKKSAVQKALDRLIPKKFTGKPGVTKQGLKSINRKYTDRVAWMDRRKQEVVPPGGWPKPPKHWPEGVRVDIGRPVWWLPPGWGQGIKTTCVTKLQCYVSPEGKKYYHRHDVETAVGVKLPEKDPNIKQVEWAQRRARIAISEAKTFRRKAPKFGKDARLFAQLTAQEKRCLPESADDFYFAVVSARRATDEKGLSNICSVQASLVASGADPTWYVDAASLQAYKALGLKAKVGGKLVPARNMALRDAARAGKPCVQVSDDISGWDYYVGEMAKCEPGSRVDLSAGNEAARNADHLKISPVAAARFLLAKMRAAQESAGGGRNAGPHLGGVFPLGNAGQAFTRQAVTTDQFILGDFFVADSSPVRFEPRMSLKEDYDFTCEHLAKHGQVLRCNRLFIRAIHETNAGGAVSERDDAGDREREMIKILKEKWPGAFWCNSKRGDTQVILSWKRRKTCL